MDIEHETFDLWELERALQGRHFAEAARFVPLVEIPDGFGAFGRVKPLPFKGIPHGMMVASPGTTVSKIKRAIWIDEGAHTSTPQGVFERAEFERKMKLARELSKLGVGDYGPQPW